LIFAAKNQRCHRVFAARDPAIKAWCSKSGFRLILTTGSFFNAARAVDESFEEF
jgi:hypothetical protein